MQIKISARHGHLSEATQEFIREKADKLMHSFDRLMMIEVTVDLKDEQKVVEFLVSAEHKHDFVARERNKDVLAAVDLVLDKLEQQVRKYKEKIQDHRRTPSTGEVAGTPSLGRRAGRPVREDAAMRMSDFVVREAISADLAATTKEGVIREMVENLRRAGYFKGSEPEDIVKAILKRELLGSTGIGRGVAIPHTKHTSVDRLDRHRRRLHGGVPSRASTASRCTCFVMLISPQERPGRPPAGPGERLALPARRRLRPLAAAGRRRRKQIWDCSADQDNQRSA